MFITDQERKYLKNKHKGGVNNTKGCLYENYYAVYSILVLMNKYNTQLNNIYLSSQVENAFVDDFLIVYSDHHKTYCQLKNVQSLTWQTGKLKYDFIRQKEISTKRQENFDLLLVYSDSRKAVVKIPDEIVSCTTTSFFPNCRSLNELILSYEPFKQAILNIVCNKQIEDDKLFGIAGAFLGAWNSTSQQNVTLNDIISTSYIIGKGFININIPETVNIEISDESQKIFKDCGLDYQVNGSMLTWNTKNNRLKGELKWSEDIEEKLSDIHPSDMWNLIEILS